MYPLARKLLFRLDAETAHHLTVSTLSRFPNLGKWMGSRTEATPSLSQILWGRTFSHPVGLAAGLDKNAVALDAWFQMGFAFAEVGTVTPMPQPGNPQPRLFRLVEDEALINRMGFNNDGAKAMLRRLERRPHAGIVGVNFGKNKWTPNESAEQDYATLAEILLPQADYVVMNVSSPNTPGLRDLQTLDSISRLVQAVQEKRAFLASRKQPEPPNSAPPGATGRTLTPILVKLAPDLSDDALIELSHYMLELGVEGLIATNTTLTRDGLRSAGKNETGGLSGKPLRARSTQVVRLVHEATEGRLPIIASGGVFTAADAYEKIRAGATLVQLYTALIYRGPAVVSEVVQGLQTLLREDGYAHIREAIGSAH